MTAAAEVIQTETPRLDTRATGLVALAASPQWRRRLLVASVVAVFLVLLRRFVPHGMAPAAALVGLWVLVALWRPELTMSAILVGSVSVHAALPGSQLRYRMVAIILFFAVGFFSVGVRWALRDRKWGRMATELDTPVAAIALFAMLSVVIGILRGNELPDVVSGAYHVVQWPLYYLLVTWSVNSRERLGLNWALMVSVSIGTTVVMLLAPQRALGLSTWLPIIVALLLMRKPFLPRSWLGIAAAVGLVDMLRSGHRTGWLSNMVALAWFVTGGSSRDRFRASMVVLSIGAVAVMLTASLFFVEPVRNSPPGVVFHEAIMRPPGYRIYEAWLGWQIFLKSPVWGHGFGYREPNVWIPGREKYGVGPSYHMFHMTVLTQQGAIGLLLAGWMIGVGVLGRAGTWVRGHCFEDPWAAAGYGLQARAVGSLVGALFAGPRISHYEWLLYPALSVICARFARQSMQRPAETDPVTVSGCGELGE